MHAPLPQHRPGRAQAGFSIVEMLVVFTVLAVAIIPLAGVQFHSRHEISEAMRESQAVQLAQSQIEQVKMAGFAAAVGDTADVGVFHYETAVVADPVNPFLREIQVVVTWQYGSEERSLRLASKQSAR